MRLLMPDERRFVDALGQDVDSQRRQRDASVPEGAEEPPDDVGRWARGHAMNPKRLISIVVPTGNPAMLYVKPVVML